ncbi:cytochrome P450, putative [Ricinus communis]|uniref:Cytochrome P450, putative n=2 Tax=Ricinus communis TaxID=3988 RepID=B9SPD1_RICCO|nr:cytochrome P450, putative [Ricinus communis]|eukprot:XP_002527850.1 cytochrome P450 87A3 [Ricinus communis]
MLTIILFLVALLPLYYAFWINKWRNPNSKGVLPPGSMGFPVIGETLQLLIPSFSLDIHPFIRKRTQRYGPIFRSNLAGQSIVISTDPEFNRYILTQEGRLVEIWYLNTFSKIFSLEGESRTTAAGEIHKYMRGTFLTQFGLERLKEKLLPQIVNMVNETLYSWSTQEVIKVKHAVSTTICDFTAKIFCGYDARVSPDKLSECFTTFAEGLMSFPLNLPGTTYYQCLKNQQKAINILKKMVKERRTSAEKHVEDFLSTALNDMEKEKFLTDDFITTLLFGLLFASFETISTTMTLMLNLLSSHPSVLQDLMAEHESILQNKPLDSSIKWDEYKSMTFTHQVINETLRLGNVAPGLLRKAIKDVHYKGYTIPAGWTIMVATSIRHVNPEIYKNPLVFNPYRWKDLDSHIISKNFTPFGGGTRQCVGAEYSRVILAIFLHVLVTKYR